MRQDGLQNEYDIIELLNEKKVRDLPEFWIRFIKYAFPMCTDDDLVSAHKEAPNQKQDFRINMCGTRRTVSVKCGEGNSVHEESLMGFVGFLKWLGISEKSRTFLQYYHYGDGTIDGTGPSRMDSNDLIELYKDEIKEFNREVNDPDKLHIIIKRFLMLGTPIQRSCVNYFYHGTKDGGMYCDMVGLCEFLAYRGYKEYDRIHFGPFTYSPCYRGLTYNLKYLSVEQLEKVDTNKRRYYLNIKWPSLKYDLVTYIKMNYK